MINKISKIITIKFVLQWEGRSIENNETGNEKSVDDTEKTKITEQHKDPKRQNMLTRKHIYRVIDSNLSR